MNALYDNVAGAPSFEAMFDALPLSSLRILSADGERDARSLADAVERCAEALTVANLRRIASRLDNGAPWLILDLALRRIGGAHIPLPTFFTPAQTAHALRASGAEAVVVADAMAPPDAVSLVSGLRASRLDGAQVALPAGTACITYTSGTTAQAKGVCLDAASMLRVAVSLTEATAALRPRRHLCLMPLSTLLENIAGVYAAWLTDAEIAVPSLAEIGYSGAAGLDIAILLRCLHRYAPESVIVFPQLLLALTMAAEQGHVLPSSLRFVAVGGGRVGEGLLARAAAVGLPVYEGYGLTECASVVCLNRPGAMRPGSVGRPLSHARVFVRDEELWVDGVRCLGYLDDADALPPGPIATGDLGHIDDDGFVRITGRRKHMFVTAYGRNVSPEWVETEVLQHPLFAQAVVLGEARPHNVAVLWPRRPDADAASIRRALAEINRGLPDYAQVGDYVLADAPFAVENGLLTPNGRARRDAIAQRYADAIDARYASCCATGYAAASRPDIAPDRSANETCHENPA